MHGVAWWGIPIKTRDGRSVIHLRIWPKRKNPTPFSECRAVLSVLVDRLDDWSRLPFGLALPVFDLILQFDFPETCL